MTGKKHVVSVLPLNQVQKDRLLEWLQLNSAGSDPYEVPGVLKEGVLLTNAVGAYGQTVSEHMTASLLTMLKRLHQYRDNQNKCLWQDEGPVGSISQNRILIVGFGSIGSHLGKLLHALGNQVVGIRRKAYEKPEWVTSMHNMDSLNHLLPEMDVVALCLPSSGSTLKLFSKEQFSLMKPGAFFLNSGRGNLVDTEALLHALESGPLAGAALDVTEPEPLPQNHPLWMHPKALITPHISGGFHMEVTMERIVDICCENLVRFASGESLKNTVHR